MKRKYIHLHELSTSTLVVSPCAPTNILCFFLSFFIMALSQLPQLPQILSPYFDNGITTNQLQIFFPLLFRQYHCHKSISQFFILFFRNDMCTFDLRSCSQKLPLENLGILDLRSCSINFRLCGVF